MSITLDDYLRANRKASREEEIAAYGHPICHKRVFKSKKVYDRKRSKAGNKDLPYLFYIEGKTGVKTKLRIKKIPQY